MATIGILGAGTWGTALACLLAKNGHAVRVWSHSVESVRALYATQTHPNLPDAIIPEHVQFSNDIAIVSEKRDLLLIAVPSVYVRETATLFKPYISQKQIIAIASKGIEEHSLFTMSEVVASELGSELAPRIVALSGPTHAEEVSRGLPSAIVAASEDADAARYVQKLISCETMRAYTQKDIHGVELCGALKNIIALACGISTGLGYGDNTRAALITRGMEEIKRLGLALGCAEQTFAGLAGIGDLVVTATSMHSRNNRAGILLGQGKTAEEAMAEVGMVVEGINALPAAMGLSIRHDIEMPITEAVNAVVAGTLDPHEAVSMLMNRDVRPEV